MTDLTREGASDAPVRILLAHGAGAGMEHSFLAELSRLLAGPEIEVVRFNFPYMTKRAQDGKRRPPDRQPVLLAHWREMVRQLVVGNEAVARTARKVLKTAEAGGDDPSVDLMTQRLQVHEKNAWMLRSLLQ